MKALRNLIIIFSIIVLSGISTPVLSQCAMCRAVAESGSKDSRKIGHGLNSGIIYLLSIPYVMGGVAFFIWRKNKNNNTEIS